MSEISQRPLEDELIEMRAVSLQEMDRIKKLSRSTGERLERIVLTEGLAIGEKILKLIAAEMGVEYINLDNAKINPRALLMLDADTARKYSVFPFDIENNLLFLAMQFPDDIFMIDEIKVFAQMEIKPFLADAVQIARILEEQYSEKVNDPHLPEQNLQRVYAAENAQITSGDDSFGRKNTDAVRELLNDLITEAEKLDACRMHISPCEEGIKARFRTGGRLVEEKYALPLAGEVILEKIRDMAGLKARNINLEQTGFVTCYHGAGDKVNIEVSGLIAANEDKLLLKILSNTDKYQIDNLGFTEYEKSAVINMISKKSGMIIITGPEASGRSSTCHSLLKSMQAQALNIVTVEKRNSNYLKGVNQILIPEGQEYNISKLIKSALNDDPDVILVDADIDEAALKLLMNASLSGKLIIAVMNLSGVYNTILGLVNMGIDCSVAAAAVNGIISQRLIRKVCPQCKGKGFKVRSSSERIEEGGFKNDLCNVCNRGFKGVTALFEVFAMNREYQQLLAKNNAMDIIESRIKNGKSTFRTNYIRLVNDDVISIEEITRLGIVEE